MDCRLLISLGLTEKNERMPKHREEAWKNGPGDGLKFSCSKDKCDQFLDDLKKTSPFPNIGEILPLMYLVYVRFSIPS